MASILLSLAVALVAGKAAADAPALEVHVVESHHDVLLHWLEAAEDGALPDRGVEVVHVDAHPDLAVPTNALPTAGRRNPQRLHEALDIASFQLAAVHLGLVDRIVWLRPGWARQLPDGEREFHVGLLPDRRLRTDDPSHYWVLADGWAPTHWLRRRQTLRLVVAPLGSPAWQPTAEGSPWVLDVDLDVFATHNPAATRLRAMGLRDEDLAVLRGVFSLERLALPEPPAERAAFFALLSARVGDLARGTPYRRLSAAHGLWQMGVGPVDALRILLVLRRASAIVPSDELLWLARKVVSVPEAATATEAERIATCEAILAVVEQRGRPALVTIARSSRDGFTPPEVARWAEPCLLRGLEARVGPLEVRWQPGLRPFAAAPPPTPP